MKISKVWKGRKHSEESRRKISEGMQKAVRLHPDSYSSSNVNGRVKKVEYKGVLLDSQWEVDLAIWLDQNGIIWERPNKGFEYDYKGKKHIYYPDFYLPQLNIYVEVKGYKREKDEYKWKSLNNLIVVKRKEIEDIHLNKFNLLSILNKKGL